MHSDLGLWVEESLFLFGGGGCSADPEMENRIEEKRRRATSSYGRIVCLRLGFCCDWSWGAGI
jgi:hypothetical protein